MRSILVRSFISEATLTLPPAMTPAYEAQQSVHHTLPIVCMHFPAHFPSEFKVK